MGVAEHPLLCPLLLDRATRGADRHRALPATIHPCRARNLNHARCWGYEVWAAAVKTSTAAPRSAMPLDAQTTRDGGLPVACASDA